MRDACSLNKTDFIYAYNHLVDNIENMHKEHGSLKTSYASTSLDAFDVAHDENKLHEECFSKIAGLQIKLQTLTQENNIKNI